eukprot:CAMPEP_0182498006 /NCGR_PEP_ID=MMETSP1321-20130603/6353_1 /TAXON_ID=91990 /ORGANISM="Bolidomonas sp., Strain RCC1657" /LENGTH=1411 /DNA_ID=CAMNT_0024702007 /DNA_START=67 /DNA_END=4302 /DNA_ORIENTATION=-
MCLDLSSFNGVYKPVAKTLSGRWYYENEYNKYLYFDPACICSFYTFNEWIFGHSEPSITAESNLDGDSTRSSSHGYIASNTVYPPAGTNLWKIFCDGIWVGAEINIDTNLRADHQVNNQQELYDTISQNGANIMKSGDHALVGPGTYKCFPCHDEYVPDQTVVMNMFVTSRLFGSIICRGEILSCVLHGESTRRILKVEGTSISVLTITGIRFFSGATPYYRNNDGGGMIILKGAVVRLEFCALNSCSAYYGGAVNIEPTSTLSAYGTSFASNWANDGMDVYNIGDLIVFDTCPDKWIGIPEEGSPLDLGGRPEYGSPYSFTVGSCSICPLGSANAALWYDLSSVSTCQNCTVGRFRSNKDSSCTVCSAGKFNDKDNSDASYHSSCYSCRAGKYLSDDGTSVLLHDDETDCAICTSGKYSDVAASSCVLCEKGKYLLDQGTHETFHNEPSDCTDCEAGKYNESPGGISCKFCGKGKYITTPGAVSETQCKSCAKGKYNDGIGLNTDCYSCVPGKIAPSAGYEVCADCVTGTYASTEGLTSCSQCEESKHASTRGSEVCSICTNGTYTDYEGAVKCQVCPQHTTFSNLEQRCVCLASFIEINSTCSCNAGETLIDGRCDPCEDGRYKDHVGTESCTVCDTSGIKGAFMSVPGVDKTSIASCACGIGKVSDGTLCMDCVSEGMNCTSVGLTIETIPMREGFWRSSPASTKFLTCLNPKHCKGGVETTDLCSDGYTGPLCAVCASGYAAVGFGESLTCNSCDRGTEVVTAIVIISMLLLIAMLFFCCLRKKRKEEDAQSLLRQNSNASMLIEKSIKRFEKYQPIFKMIVTYFQVVGGLGYIYGLRFPPIFTSITSFIGGLASFNFISFIPLGCVAQADFYSQLLVYTLTPLLISIVLIGWYKYLSGSTSPEAKDLQVKIFEVFLAITFIVLPSVSVKIFSTFACQKFDDGYGSYLKVDLSLDCNNSQHKFYEIYALFMALCYPVGIPLMYFVLLYKKRDKLDPGQAKFAASTSMDDALKKALEIRSGYEKDDVTLRALGFLYSSYEPYMWWFEVFETLRRIGLTGFLIFLDPGTSTQVVLSLILCISAMRVYSGCKPFISEFIDSFSEAVQWQLFYTMLGALIIKVNLDGMELHEQGIFDVVLTLIQFLPVSIIVLLHARNVEELEEPKQALHNGLIVPVKKKISQNLSTIGTLIRGRSAGEEEKINPIQRGGADGHVFADIGEEGNIEMRSIEKEIQERPGVTGNLNQKQELILGDGGGKINNKKTVQLLRFNSHKESEGGKGRVTGPRRKNNNARPSMKVDSNGLLAVQNLATVNMEQIEVANDRPASAALGFLRKEEGATVQKGRRESKTKSRVSKNMTYTTAFNYESEEEDETGNSFSSVNPLRTNEGEGATKFQETSFNNVEKGEDDNV